MSEAIDEVKKQIQLIPSEHVFYALRQMKLRNISEQQINTVKIFLALRHFGLNIIPTTLFKELYGRTYSNALRILHLLGDKKVLMLVRNKKTGPMRYILSETFLSFYEHRNRKS